MSRIIISIYVHPEFYPPTLNAIINLSERFNEVIVITRNNIQSDFPFPSNVKIKSLGKRVDVIESERLNLVSKVLFFLKFTSAHLPFFLNARNKFLCYDPIPLFAVVLVKKVFFRKNFIWYHNHDMPNINSCRKYSISWFASKYEKLFMKEIDVFSLPSEDRKQFYFDVDFNNFKYYFLPNYPSLKVFHKGKEKLIDSKIKVLYQGSVAPKRAFEELAHFIKRTNLLLELNLKGPIRNNYDADLVSYYKKLSIESSLVFHGITTYKNLVSDIGNYDLGLAVQLGDDDIRKTLGTASNKIYEYGASGLPVIVSDNQQFRKYLNEEKWVFFYNRDTDNFEDIFSGILLNYESISLLARDAFFKKFNFELFINRITIDK